MGINLPQVAAGAVAGAIAGDAYADAKNRAQNAAGNPTVQHGTVEDQMLVEMVSRIEKAIHEAQAANCPPQFVTKLLPALAPASGAVVDGYHYVRRGYKHVSLLAAAAFTLVVRTEIGNISFSMSAGWNACDFPHDVLMWANGATDTKVVFYYGDDQLDIPGV